MEVTADAYEWVARQVVRQHRELAAIVDATDPATGGPWPYPTHAAGRCKHCPAGEGKCRNLVWALAELAAVERSNAIG